MGQFGQFLDLYQSINPRTLNCFQKTSQIIAHFNPYSEGFQNLKVKFEKKKFSRQKILPELGKKMKF